MSPRSTSVSYTHLDVYKRQEICLSDEAQRAYRTLNGRVRLFAVEGPVPKGIQALREFKSALRARKLDENALLAAKLSLRKNGEPVNGGRPAAPDQSMARLTLRVALGVGDIAKACLLYTSRCV